MGDKNDKVIVVIGSNVLCETVECYDFCKQYHIIQTITTSFNTLPITSVINRTKSICTYCITMEQKGLFDCWDCHRLALFYVFFYY